LFNKIIEITLLYEYGKDNYEKRNHKFDYN
jgi:hypothetical protein